MQSVSLRILALGLLGWLAGCASVPSSRVELAPIKLLAKDEGRAVEVLDAKELFEAGGKALAAEQYRRALRSYDQLLEHFPQAKLVSPTLYNAGLAHESLGEFERAAERYRELIEGEGTTPRSLEDALFRLGGCYAELQRWSDSAITFERLLRREGLSISDRVEALARKGLAHFRLQQHESARRDLRRALDLAREHADEEPLERSFFVGLSQYYVAAIPHVAFREAELSAGEQLQAQMDEKARLLLVAQGRYIRTIRIGNPYWAAAAGFQIGSLYREFYDSLMAVLPDFKAQARKNARRAKTSVEVAYRELVAAYFRQLHDRLRPLLQKAIRVFERNVLVAQRLGVRSGWVAKSRYQIEELKRLLTASPDQIVGGEPDKVMLPEDSPGPRS